MNYLDEAVTKSLDEFMECYKVVDTEEIYSNGTEFVPIFRVKQWEEYNNKDKEIERLNNIIEEYKNANEYHQNIIHELETMKQPNQLHSENVKLRAENNRLNNIINEFDKLIKNEINESKLEDDYERVDSLEYCLATLKELKGSDKE